MELQHVLVVLYYCIIHCILITLLYVLCIALCHMYSLGLSY